MVDREKLDAQLIDHEDVRLFPYVDTKGKITIGVGRNLTDRGITYEQAMEWLHEDEADSIHELTEAFPWFSELDEVRQAVLIDMHFNMGMPVLKRFKKFLAYMAEGDHAAAAGQMISSLWYKQTGRRARNLVYMMVHGERP